MPILALEITYLLPSPSNQINADIAAKFIEPALIKLLSAFHAAHWKIVTVSGCSMNTTTTFLHKKRLQEAGFQSIISANYPDTHHDDDIKSETLLKYMRQFKIIKQDELYYYNVENFYIKLAKKRGFQNSHAISQQDLFSALKELADKYQIKGREVAQAEAPTTNNTKKTKSVIQKPKLSRDGSLLKTTPDEIITNLFISRLDYGNDRLNQLIKQPEMNAAILRATNYTIYHEITTHQLETIQEKICVFELADETTDLSPYFQQSFEFIDAALNKKRPVLVHDVLSDEKSPTLVAAYLMKKFNLTAKEACHHLRKNRPCCDFSKYRQQLEKYEQELNLTKNALPEEKHETIPEKPSVNFFKRLWLVISTFIKKIRSKINNLFSSPQQEYPPLKGLSTSSIFSSMNVTPRCSIDYGRDSISIPIPIKEGNIHHQISDAEKVTNSLPSPPLQPFFGS